MKPSTAKVLRLLEQAGKQGVTTGQFAEQRCPRAAARVHELRRAGYDILAVREEANAYRFVLRGARLGGEGRTSHLAAEPGAAVGGWHRSPNGPMDPPAPDPGAGAAPRELGVPLCRTGGLGVLSQAGGGPARQLRIWEAGA